MYKIYRIALVAFLASIVISLPTNQDQHKRKSAYCRYKDLNIKQGETIPAPTGDCSKVKCKNAERNVKIKLTCPVYQASPGCEIREKYLTKPYPNCCPIEVCPDISQDEQLP